MAGSSSRTRRGVEERVTRSQRDISSTPRNWATARVSSTSSLPVSALFLAKIGADVDNFALAVWEKNGFAKVGTVPNAGRLRTGPGGAEEYVDAFVLYKSFV